MFNFNIFKSKPKSINPCVLISLDGFGIAPESKSNAIYLANMKNYSWYLENYPSGRLIAAGESSGLPANEAGNSEVGHLIMGAGRVINQSLVRINKSIEDETFYRNESFVNAINLALKNNSKLHLMGLVSSGNVHSSTNHLYALLELCNRMKFHNVFIHLFTDGRDAPQKDGINVIKEVEKYIDELKIGNIISISGRYWAMDRDARWSRTQKTYESMVLGRGLVSKSAHDAIDEAYRRGETDEFIQPTVIPVKRLATEEIVTIDDGDSVIFFNFRIDRPRQLAMAFVMSDFENIKQVDFGYLPHELKSDEIAQTSTFKREKWPKNLFFVTMTEYQKNMNVSAVAFPPPEIHNSLPEVISSYGLRQMHLAESEKERMVTFYFNGLREEKYSGEDVKIVSSPKVPTYDKKPEMSANGIYNEFKKSLKKDKYSFFMINFANPDMVGHTGDLKATIQGLKCLDKILGNIFELVLKVNGTVVISADHGNSEQLLTFAQDSFFYTSDIGTKKTEHTNNPVPVLIVNNSYKGKMVGELKGALYDLAPTILQIMRLKVPEEMTGKDLLSIEAKVGV